MNVMHVLDYELERMHEWYGTGTDEFNLEIWKRILTLQEALIGAVERTVLVVEDASGDA